MSEPTMSSSCILDEEGTRGFSRHLKQIRSRLESKQDWLSGEIGCSSAALSFWESGARLPTARSLHKIVVALARSGVSTLELIDLRRSWCMEMDVRSARAQLARPEQSSSAAGIPLVPRIPHRRDDARQSSHYPGATPRPSPA